MSALMDKLPLILDGVAAAAVLFCASWKGTRGLCKCLVPLAVTLVSLVGAFVLTTVFRERVTEAVFPWVRDQVISRIDLSSIRSLDLEDITRQLGQLLPRQILIMGQQVETEDLQSLVEKAMESIPRATAQRVAESATESLLYPVTASVVRVGLFVVSFLALRLALGFVSALLGLMANISIIRPLDVAGGVAIGLAESIVVIWLLCSFARAVDIPLLTQGLEQTRLLRLLL